MDDGTMMENQFQIALIDLAFQLVGTFLNVLVLVFQQFTTGILEGVFSLFSGGTTM